MTKGAPPPPPPGAKTNLAPKKIEDTTIDLKTISYDELMDHALALIVEHGKINTKLKDSTLKLTSKEREKMN
jgi:hypothetical protein